MERLSDIELIDTYRKARELNCSPDFILLLLNELRKRKIEAVKLKEFFVKM